jgi:hypothetical protein
VEKNAVNTLKYVVQRLINDFEAEDGVNEIREFSQSDKETKREALSRLLMMMGGKVDEKKSGKSKPK